MIQLKRFISLWTSVRDLHLNNTFVVVVVVVVVVAAASAAVVVILHQEF